MKKLIIIIAFTTLFYSCDNDDSPDCTGIDCLPPITQTGAGTFGCLVNGEPFYGTGGVVCFYQLVNGEYYFAVGLPRESGYPLTVSIESSEREIQLGSQILGEAVNNNIYGSVRFPSSENFLIGTTSDDNTGLLTITRLDQLEQIVSGEFEFSILDPNTEQILNITEGRFDSFYAR